MSKDVSQGSLPLDCVYFFVLCTISSRAFGSVVHLTNKLPTSRIDIVTACRPYCDDESRFHQDFPKARDSITTRTFKARVRKIVEGNEVNFTGVAIQQLSKLTGVLNLIINTG